MLSTLMANIEETFQVGIASLTNVRSCFRKFFLRLFESASLFTLYIKKGNVVIRRLSNFARLDNTLVKMFVNHLINFLPRLCSGSFYLGVGTVCEADSVKTGVP
jgi:hypothetical protein